MRFYLGTHEVTWLAREDVAVPLFVSRRRLEKRRTLPRAVAPWALDSGGFTELTKYGGWRTSADEYVAVVERLAVEVGRLEWAAPQDWMCEPHMLEATGLTIEEHQRRTVANFVELAGRGPFVPVLQGWAEGDYHRCVELYDDAGVDLRAFPVVGLGTVCRRQATGEVAGIVSALTDGYGLRVHGFGVKLAGLRRTGHTLVSADSMAWSSWGRNEWHHRGRRMCGGDHAGGCASCPRWALMWRDRVVDGLGLFAGAETAPGSGTIDGVPV